MVTSRSDLVRAMLYTYIYIRKMKNNWGGASLLRVHFTRILLCLKVKPVRISAYMVPYCLFIWP